MAKTKLSEYSATAASNTDINSINIDEGMSPSNVNNAIRELMAQLKNMEDGTDAVTAIKSGNIQITSNTISSTDTNGNINITPNGTGSVVLDGINYPQADGTANYFLKTNGAGQLSFAQVDTASIAADAIDGTKIADDSIDSEHYVDGSIDTAHLADDAVTSAKIADNNVGAAELNVSGNGTSGQMLTSDGDGSMSWADAGGGGLQIVQDDTFTSSGTWNKHADANVIVVRAAGASGGVSNSNIYGSINTIRGSGGGGTAIIECGGNDLGNTMTVTIGSGGSPNNNTNQAGNAGGTTTIGNYVTLNGGEWGGYLLYSNSASVGFNTPASGGTANTNLSVGGNVTKVETASGGDSAYGAGLGTIYAETANTLENSGISTRGGRILGFSGNQPNNSLWRGSYNYNPRNQAASEEPVFGSGGFAKTFDHNMQVRGREGAAPFSQGVAGHSAIVKITQFGDL